MSRVKYHIVKQGLWNIAVYILPSISLNNDITKFPKYKTVEVELTSKPWGCVCGYCKENDTLYLHDVAGD